jgi:hypothetical protein
MQEFNNQLRRQPSRRLSSEDEYGTVGKITKNKEKRGHSTNI